MRRSVSSVVSVVLVVAAVLAVASAAGAARGSIAYRELGAGSRGANLPGERLQAVGRLLRTRAEAVGVLRAWGLDPAAARSLDFARKRAIVVLAEYAPSGGYRARVSRVARRGREVVVTAGVRYEGGDVAVSDLERPWVVIAVNRADVAGAHGTVRVLRR